MNVDQLEQALRDVGARHRPAAAALDEVERERADLIAQALAAGMTTRRIGELLGISFQRVSQIARR